MHISMIAAGITGLLLVILGLRISAARRRLRISTGDGGNPELAGRIRAHGNATEWIPIGLILIFLAEQAAGRTWYVGALAAAFVIARLLHPFGMRTINPAPARVVAATTTYISTALLAILVLTHTISRCTTCSLA